MTQEVTDEVKAKELENLRAQAETLGLDYHPNTGAKKLAELIDEALAAAQAKTQPVKKDATVVVKEESRRAKALKLVRVIVTPNDPNKRDQDGDFFSAGNSLIGTVTKFIPYNNEAGWHVPQIILDTLRDKKMQRFKKVKTAGGVDIRVPSYTPAYAIQILEPLTKEELKKLGDAQRARQSVD